MPKAQLKTELLETTLFNGEPISDLREIPADVLAYIGDSFFNLYSSIKSIGDGRKSISRVNKDGVKLKRAEGQKEFLSSITPFLDEAEKEIVKRGINSKGAKKRGNCEAYRVSTGFECLIGYLFLEKNWKRLNEILNKSKKV